MHVQQNNSFRDTRRKYLGGGKNGPNSIEQPETCMNCGAAVNPTATVCSNCNRPMIEED